MALLPMKNKKIIVKKFTKFVLNLNFAQFSFISWPIFKKRKEKMKFG